MSDLPADVAGDTSSSNSPPVQAVADYDGAWKNALDAYFPEFMALLWPTLHAQIDWTHTPVFLDKELQKLTAISKHGRLHVDKLVRVRLLSGKEALTLIHTEVQGGTNDHKNLPSRMFTYHMRLKEKHPQHPLVSLAVLTHRSSGPSTQTYAYEHWGCSLTFSFPVVNLESWRPRTSELVRLAPQNPFAVVVLAQLEANARHPGRQQFVRKTALVRRLHDWGFARDQIVLLFNILDAMLVLPVSMEQHFIQAISQIEEEYNMTYVNTIERVALRRGREEGLKEGKQAGLKEGKQEGLQEGKQEGLQEGRQEGKREAAAGILTAQLGRRFGELPDWALIQLAEADQTSLDRWAVQILDAQRLEDVFA